MRAKCFRLRDFAFDDLAEIEAFWVGAWTATGLEIDFEARRPWLREHLKGLVDRGVRVIVGLDDHDAPRGFVTLDPENGYLDQLCVAPSHQGGGLAKALLDEAKRHSPRVVELKVNADNPKASRFYEREGFSTVGRESSEMSGLPVRRMIWRAGPRS